MRFMGALLFAALEAYRARKLSDNKLTRHVLDQRYRIKVTAGALPNGRGDGHAESEEGDYPEATDQTP